MKLTYTSTQDQIANFHTKAATRKWLSNVLSKLGIINIYTATWGGVLWVRVMRAKYGLAMGRVNGQVRFCHLLAIIAKWDIRHCLNSTIENYNSWASVMFLIFDYPKKKFAVVVNIIKGWRDYSKECNIQDIKSLFFAFQEDGLWLPHQHAASFSFPSIAP